MAGVDAGAQTPEASAITDGSALAADPAWRELFDQLGAPATRFSTFEERRHFPFRREPVVLAGEIRILPGRGLSLRYPEPPERIMIVDAEGMLLRDARGRERTVPRDHRAQAVTRALIDVLRFDLAGLQEKFSVKGVRNGSAWTLTFTPRDPGLVEQIESLVVEGEATRPSRIEIRQKDRQRIEIRIGATREDFDFTAAEIKRFFR